MKFIRHMNSKKQKGFTLIESLLTLFILTIGILGAAGLQMQGLRAGSVAMQRMIAVMKTKEIIERMRANNNIEQRIATAGAGISLNAYNGGGLGSNEGCNTGTVCTSALMAATDLFMWQTDLANTLPGFASADVVVNAPPGNSAPVPVTVTINWVDRGDNYTYSVSVDI